VKAALGVLSVGLPFVALAEPVYLNCVFSKDGESKTFSVALDEANRKVTHTGPEGSGFNADGFFAATTITYQRISTVGPATLTVRYDIDRTTLEVSEVVILEAIDPRVAAKVPVDPITSHGSCTIVSVPERKI